MIEKICRLCFNEKPHSIGIFTAKGLEMNIGETIRLHFADEISENDHFPKLVCFDCWTKLKRFHEFYKAVNSAKNDFLLKFVKNEEPKFMEINCDAIDCDEDIPSVKHETVPVAENVKFEKSMLDKDKPPDAVESENCSIGQLDDFDAGVFFSNGNDTDDDGSECEPTANNANGKLESANARNEDVKETRNTKKEGDDLIPEYLNMICDLCEHPFKKISETIDHFQEKHKIYTFKVKCCQRRKLRSMNDIREHIQYHLDPNKFKCTECGIRFGLSVVLSNHMRIHRRERYECDICKKKLRSFSGINNHMVVKHMPVQERHECHICMKRLKTKNSLVSHLKQIHERRKQLVCHICAKGYATKQGLLDHLKEHNDVKEPRVNCEYCGKSSKTEKSLQNHIRRKHQFDGKVYKCRHCQKQCANKSSLYSHIVYNHNFKTHKCDICGKECKTTKKLKEHVAVHTGVDLYECDYCPRTFKASSNKFTHMKRMHPIELKAEREAKLQRK